MAADHSKDVFHHIRDSFHFELPGFLGGNTPDLPLINLGFYQFQITKFMVLQVVAGLLVLVIFSGLARHIRSGRPARGMFWNFPFWKVRDSSTISGLPAMREASMNSTRSGCKSIGMTGRNRE